MQIVSERVLFFYLFVLGGGALSLLKFYFFRRFFGGQRKVSAAVCYLVLIFMLGAVQLGLGLSSMSFPLLFLQIFLLWSVGRAFYKRPPFAMLLSAAVAEITALIAGGMSASLNFLAMPVYLKTAYGLALGGIVGPIFTLLLLLGAYYVILKKISWREDLPERYFILFFLPVLLILMVEQYIFNQIYGNVIIVEGTELVKPFADHSQLLLIQLFACFGLFSTLYACQRLAEDFANRTRMALLEQETKAQRCYVEESRLRCEQTGAFRHDIKNHLLALDGLLERGCMQQARDYLENLNHASEALSFSCQTGNAVVDVLLNSKLGFAGQIGIDVECAIKLPQAGAFEDMDLCILFSNALDNAVNACKAQKEGKRFIWISGSQKGDFFMMEVENSCPVSSGYVKGTGLSNMEIVAEKYQGAVNTEKKGNCFRLYILLVISRHPADISG